MYVSLFISGMASETEKQTSQEDLLVIENEDLKKDIIHLKEMLTKQFEKELENNIKVPIIYFFDGRSPSRHKQSFFI